MRLAVYLLAAVSAFAANTITVTNNGSTTTNLPVQIGRPFVQGEIPNGSLPQASISGTPINTQVDVKSRWPDLSLKHAVISFMVPSITANQTVTVTFAAGTTVGNTAVTKNQMLDVGLTCPGAGCYNFDAATKLTVGATTKFQSARTMLSNDDYTTWISGPIATTVVIANHAQGFACSSGAASGAGSTTSKYDFGFDSFCAFRPSYIATFWPVTHQVYVEAIGELVNTEQLENITVDSVNITVGFSSPTSIYTKSTSTLMTAMTRFVRRGWIGGTPPVSGIGHNIGYLASTKFIANYDTQWLPSNSALTTLYSNWTSASKEIYDAGLFDIYMPDVGGRPGDEVGIYPGYVVQWLYTGDYRAQTVSLGQADLAEAWPIHLREGNSSKNLIITSHWGSTVSGIGHVISVASRPSMQLIGGLAAGNPADNITAVGTVSGNGWVPDGAHQPQWGITYAVTGDYFFLEQMWFWAGWSTAYAYGSAYFDDEVGRGPTGVEGHISSFVSVPYQVRGSGWVFKNRLEAAFFSPDGTSEKTYFDQHVKDAIAGWEGVRNVTGSAYQGNTMWNWGNQFAASGGSACWRVWCVDPVYTGTNPSWSHTGAPTAIHFWVGGSSGFNNVPESNTYIAGGASLPTWEVNVVMMSLGIGRDFGYSTQTLLNWVGPFLISQATDPGYNPWLLGGYRIPTKDITTGAYFTTWSQIKAQMCVSLADGCYVDSSAQTATTFDPPVNKYFGCALDPRGDGVCGAVYFAANALSFMTDQTGGSTAWSFVNTNAMQASTLNDNPKFAILPRAVASLPPSSQTKGTMSIKGRFVIH